MCDCEFLSCHVGSGRFRRAEAGRAQKRSNGLTCTVPPGRRKPETKNDLFTLCGKKLTLKCTMCYSTHIPNGKRGGLRDIH